MSTAHPFKERLQAYFQKKDIRIFPYDGQYLEAETIEFLVTDTPLLKKILDLIENAKLSIIIHIYILKEDEVGKAILYALARKAQSGVSVTLMTDTVGTNAFSPDMNLLCTESGIKWVQFNPIFSNSLIEAGRRAHHKLFLFDHTKLMLAGFNLGNEYLNPKQAHGHQGHLWHDYGIYLESRHLYEVEAAITELHNTFMIRPLYKCEAPLNKAQASFRILFQDGQRGLRDISKRINHALKNATQEILIVGAYFFPDQYFLHLLSRANKRGVKISIIVGEHSDVSWTRWASIHFLRKLIINGCSIYALHQNILHGKAIMVDNKWLTLGSYNFHFTSQFFNIEANVETTDETVLREFRQNFFDAAKLRSISINLNSLNQPGFAAKIRNFFAYQMGLILYTFYLANSKIRQP